MIPNPSDAEPAFRLAIVGAGLITRNTHVPNALSIPGIRVIAIVDPVVERARALVEDYGLDARAITDSRDLIGMCDGAVIATPNHTHRDVAVPLLATGISTLIEKPIATTVAEAHEILAAASQGKSKVALGHYQRFLDGPRLLSRLLRDRYFGRVHRFYHQFGTAGGWPAMSAYTLRRSSIGGGVLVVTGTHFLDRLLWMWGMPDSVSLTDDAAEGPESHCEAQVAWNRPESGMLSGVMRYSKCVPLPAGLVLETDAGVVMLRDGFNDRITVFDSGKHGIRSEIIGSSDACFPEGFDPSQRMLWDFVDACRNDRDPEVDGAQALLLMELLQRFYEHRSALPSRWESFAGEIQ